MTSCEYEWVEVVVAAGSGRGPEIFIVDTPELDFLMLFCKRDAGWTRDLGIVKPELQKEW